MKSQSRMERAHGGEKPHTCGQGSGEEEEEGAVGSKEEEGAEGQLFPSRACPQRAERGLLTQSTSFRLHQLPVAPPWRVNLGL